MFLSSKVVLFLLCCFLSCKGDIEDHLKNLSKEADSLMQFSAPQVKKHRDDIKKTANKLLKLVNKKVCDENAEEVTIAEMFYYQTFDEGVKGLRYYVELEAIKRGKLKTSIIPILIEINTIQQKSGPADRLYETLNDMALDMMKNREESEIEAYFKELSPELMAPTIQKIKSDKIKEIGRKVFIKLLREYGNAIHFVGRTIKSYENTEGYESIVSDLFELWMEIAGQMWIYNALEDVHNFQTQKFKIRAYGRLLELVKDDYLLKVIDNILDLDLSEKDEMIDLRKKIPCNDEKLKEMVKNSTILKFKSPKLRAVQLRNYLENDPNETNILRFGFDLKYLYTKDHPDYDYLEKTVEMLPKFIRSLNGTFHFCFMSDERYLYAEDFRDLSYSEKYVGKPRTAGWHLYWNNFNNELQLRCQLNNDKYIRYISDGEYVRVGPSQPPYTTWTLNFTDAFTHVKIGNKEKKYITVQGDSITLDDEATIWDVVAC